MIISFLDENKQLPGINVKRWKNCENIAIEFHLITIAVQIHASMYSSYKHISIEHYFGPPYSNPSTAKFSNDDISALHLGYFT